MIFSSLLFLFRFLPVMLIAYFAAPKRLRNGVLFLGSLVFYGWGEPVYISLLLFSTLVDYVHGRLIGRFLCVGKKRAARWAVASSAVMNLGLLGFFKYADFLIGSLHATTGMALPPMEVALPVGISFYTFQTMSYTIDVYRGKAKVQKNIVSFGAYVSMFPQLIAGPIVRYNTIAEELDERTESAAQAAAGVRYFVIGLAKKVLLANQMGALFEAVQRASQAEWSVLMLWLGMAAFAMQIYFDFSGYSDMAVGLGHFFGFHFPENFHYPYMADSITEFWRRWHISLGTWFKEYVYIPLGGNRRGPLLQVRNIMVVWLFTGIWHGAGWNFLLWGLYFGLLLLLEKWLFLPYLRRLPGVLRHSYAMLLVLFGWVLFSHEEIGAGIRYLLGMFGGGGLEFLNRRALYLLVTSLPLFTACVLGSTDIPKKLFWKWFAGGIGEGTGMMEMQGAGGRCAETVLLAAGLLLCVAFLVDAGYNPFLYFRF